MAETRYRVSFTRRAQREFDTLPVEIQMRFRAHLVELQTNPFPPPPLGCKLHDRDDTYRLAVGKWRLVYEVRKGELLVLVIWAGDRRDAYRRW